MMDYQATIPLIVLTLIFILFLPLCCLSQSVRQPPSPTSQPTASPTSQPTAAPSNQSNATPTSQPTPIPTSQPTAKPTRQPNVSMAI